MSVTLSLVLSSVLLGAVLAQSDVARAAAAAGGGAPTNQPLASAEGSEQVCGVNDNSTDHQPQQLAVTEMISGVEITWRRPACQGTIRRYVVSVDGLPVLDVDVVCAEEQCAHKLDTTQCNFCLSGGSSFTFRVAALFEGGILTPEAAVAKVVEVRPCRQLKTAEHAVTQCRGYSEVRSSSKCDTDIMWQRESSCDVTCQQGFGFFHSPADSYTCSNLSSWSPTNSTPGCFQIAPVARANLRYSLVYPLKSVERLEHQFEGLVHKYSDIFCAGPEAECGITDVEYVPVTLRGGAPGVEVLLTLDPPLADINDQVSLLETVEQVLSSIDGDNAFMTLIDYDNVQLVLPVNHRRVRKISAVFCCQQCPEGFAYRLGNCVQCPTVEDCQQT